MGKIFSHGHRHKEVCSLCGRNAQLSGPYSCVPFPVLSQVPGVTEAPSQVILGKFRLYNEHGAQGLRGSRGKVTSLATLTLPSPTSCLCLIFLTFGCFLEQGCKLWLFSHLPSSSYAIDWHDILRKSNVSLHSTAVRDKDMQHLLLTEILRVFSMTTKIFSTTPQKGWARRESH